jgi:hypothetical protein
MGLGLFHDKSVARLCEAIQTSGYRPKAVIIMNSGLPRRRLLAIDLSRNNVKCHKNSVSVALIKKEQDDPDFGVLLLA